MENRKIRRGSVLSLAIFVISFLFILMLKTYWDRDALEEDYKIQVSNALNAKWMQIESVFEAKYKQAFVEGKYLAENLAHSIEMEYIYTERIEDLTRDLNDLERIDNNLYNLFRESIEGVYFDDIVSDANDPFIMVIGDNPIIASDLSLNCASGGRTRTLEEEYPMHANRELAILAFNRIVMMSTPDYSNNIFDRPIFFQFLSDSDGVIEDGRLEDPIYDTDIFGDFKYKKAIELDSYDFNAFKKLFIENDGDWKSVFKSHEFIAPTYIYPTEDITGVPRVSNLGSTTSSKIITINVVFNFVDVLNNMPREREKLSLFDGEKERLNTMYIEKERYILNVGILMVFIAFLVLIGVIKITSHT